MKIARNRLIAGVVLGGLIGGATLGGVLRVAQAGPGDPPVIVLPSARAAQKPTAVVPVQATVPGLPVSNPPKLEVLPPPMSQPPIAPPLLVAPPSFDVRARRRWKRRVLPASVLRAEDERRQ